MPIRAYIQLIRPEQWIKNLFIIAPVFFGGKLFSWKLLTEASIMAVAFCSLSSLIYILNDIKDVESDRIHPKKKNRPIASGKISVKKAQALSILVAVISLLLGYLATAGWILIFYLMLQLLYINLLKKIALLDIVGIATGFVLRVLAGGVATNVMVSEWLILLTFLLALFIALGKRYDDALMMERVGLKTRRSVEGYNTVFLQNGMVLMSGIIITTYLMYITSSEIQKRFQSSYLIISVVFVILGVMRYLQSALVYNETVSPTALVYKDHFLQFCIGGWILFFIWCIYF